MWYEVFVSLCFKGTVGALEIKRDSCPLETEELHLEDLIFFSGIAKTITDITHSMVKSFIVEF